MKKLNISMIALAIGFAFSAGAQAQGISKDDYKAGKEKIAAEYKSAKVGCNSLAGNVKDICIAEAKGTEKVAKAELEASYKPTRKTHYKARVAKAEAEYDVAKERCDDKAGNEKDVCVKEAKSAAIAAKADAKVQMKTSDANATANVKTTEARTDAKKETTEVRQEATTDKRDAEYKVAKEKCDKFAGSVKDTCLNQAKMTFGK